MGRGRSKAKQAKVARDLKYSSQDMDIERLAKELHGEATSEKNFENSNFENIKNLPISYFVGTHGKPTATCPSS